MGMLYAAATFLAVTSATVVTGLNSLGSFEAGGGGEGEGVGCVEELGPVGEGDGAGGFL